MGHLLDHLSIEIWCYSLLERTTLSSIFDKGMAALAVQLIRTQATPTECLFLISWL